MIDHGWIWIDLGSLVHATPVVALGAAGQIATRLAVARVVAEGNATSSLGRVR